MKKTASQGKKAAPKAAKTAAPTKAPKDKTSTKTAPNTPTKAAKPKAATKAAPDAAKPAGHYNFYQRYSGLKLQGASLDNCKCIVWECDASSAAEAMEMFKANLREHNKIGDDRLPALLSAVFADAVRVERVEVTERAEFPIPAVNTAP